MPSSPNQRMKLLYVVKILLDRTDAENMLTMQELIAALSEYGIKAERKPLYSDMELLRRFGLDIESRKSKSVGHLFCYTEYDRKVSFVFQRELYTTVTRRSFTDCRRSRHRAGLD